MFSKMTNSGHVAVLSFAPVFRDRWDRISVVLLAAALIGAFAPTLPELVREWVDRPEFQHGMLMPLVAAWMVWDRRAELARAAASRPAAQGLFSLAPALAMVPMLALLLLGEMKLSWYLKPYAFVACVPLLVWAVFGWRVLKLLVGPLIVLLLMCPLPGRVETALTLPLKFHASILATGLLDFSGVQPTLEGNVIYLFGAPAQEVTDACSGIRSLISLFSVAVIAVMFWRRPWWLRALVVASAVPVAILINALRIWMTGYLSVEVSPAAAKGFLHWFGGLALFVTGAAILAAWAFILDRLTRRPNKAADAPAPEPGRPADAPAPAGPGAMAWAGRAVIAVALTVTLWQVYRVRGSLAEGDADPVAVAALHENLRSLPLVLDDGEYTGEVEEVPQEIIEKGGADSYVSVVYTDKKGLPYKLYIGGTVHNRENFHAPSYCMRGQGWETVEADVVPFTAYEVNQESPTMRRLFVRKAGEKWAVYYWFHAGERLADHEWTVRGYRFLDLLQGAPFRPTIIVTVYVPVAVSWERADERAADFLRSVGRHVRDAVMAKLPTTS